MRFVLRSLLYPGWVDRAQQTKTPAPAFQFRQSEALLRNVMENAAVGMALLDTNGQWLYVNRAYAERFWASSPMNA